MKANARHVPGSTRSCRAALSRFTTPTWRFQNLDKSTYKTQTKCTQKRKCDFFNRFLSTTYNFNAVTCLNSLTAHPILAIDNQTLGTESHDARLGSSVKCYPFSLGEKVRMRDKPVHSLRRPPRANELSATVHNGTKRDEFHIFTKTDHAVSTTYDDTASSRPILRRTIRRQTSQRQRNRKRW